MRGSPSAIVTPKAFANLAQGNTLGTEESQSRKLPRRGYRKFALDGALQGSLILCLPVYPA